MRIPFSRALSLAAAISCLRTASPAVAQVPDRRLTLRALLDTVASTYPTLDAARMRVRAAESARRTAGAFANPMASYQVENTAFPGSSQPPGADRETMATLTLPLEPIYQRGSRVRQANALIRASEADADVAKQSVLRDAAHAFYRVARAEVRIAALQDVANWLDTLVAYNRARVQEGVTAEADLIRTQLERDRAEIELVVQQAELARAQADLTAFSGFAAKDRVVVPTAVLAIDLTAVPPTATSRPELRAAQARVNAADASVASERRMFIRELGATVGTKQTMGTTTMIAGLSLPVPLFDRNRGEVSRAQAERDAGRYEFAAAKRMIEAEHAGAVEAIRILTAQANRFTQGDGGILARAEQAERIALGAYREGAVSLLQVLDASRARSESRMAWYDLLFAQHEAVVDFLFATGQDIRVSLSRSNPER